MKVHEIAALIEEFAPLSTQSDFDNCGLTVGDPQAEVSGILLCVDVTDEVLDEAVAKGDNLIISHHPLIFHPLRQLAGATFTDRLVQRAIRLNLNLYAAHTNLDRARGGLSWIDAERLGLQEVEVLTADGFNAAQEPIGIGIIGSLPQPVPALDFLHTVKTSFGIATLRHSTPRKSHLQRIALCSGSGGSMLADARRSGADLYLCSDLRYNDFFTLDCEPMVADIGHFESEYCAIDLLYAIITKKIATFAPHKSEYGSNPINYL